MLAWPLMGRPARAGGANAAEAGPGAGNRARGGSEAAGGSDASLQREAPARKSTPAPR
ncbi:hypothetical protein WME79_21930 [Sorangium sp. So ce726]|uniref:hypothetical protein n=1 Tax=Sorangium sp. So ce726 TaxID=3133319 RepID=UPI003F62695A